jgi:hypothetical protein
MAPNNASNCVSPSHCAHHRDPTAPCR